MTHIPDIEKDCERRGKAHAICGREISVRRLVTRNATCPECFALDFKDLTGEARRLGRPSIDLLNEEEHTRILELTWPRGWEGTEPAGDALLEKVYTDGTFQPLLEVLS